MAAELKSLWWIKSNTVFIIVIVSSLVWINNAPVILYHSKQCLLIWKDKQVGETEGGHHQPNNIIMFFWRNPNIMQNAPSQQNPFCTFLCRLNCHPILWQLWSSPRQQLIMTISPENDNSTSYQLFLSLNAINTLLSWKTNMLWTSHPTFILFSINFKYISALAFMTTTSLKTTSSSLGSYLKNASLSNEYQLRGNMVCYIMKVSKTNEGYVIPLLPVLA